MHFICHFAESENKKSNIPTYIVFMYRLRTYMGLLLVRKTILEQLLTVTMEIGHAESALADQSHHCVQERSTYEEQSKYSIVKNLLSVDDYGSFENLIDMQLLYASFFRHTARI